MRRMFSRFAGALLVGLLGTTACSDSSGPATGKLTLLLKDAAGDVQAAVVTIDEVNLQGSNGTTVLLNTPVTTNLLTLAADVDSLVKEAVIPAGTYTQLRFVISGAYIQVDNGDGTSSIYASSPTYAGLPVGATVTGSLQMPSLSQSGLKVTLPGDALTITGGDEKIMVVDFDVSQSFGQLAGGSGQWVMHPVIKATSISATGSLQLNLSLGTGVTLPGSATLGGFTATITGADNVPHSAAFADPLLTGNFSVTFPFLAPGDYTVNITAPAGVTSFTTAPAVPATSTVTAGATTTTSFSITAAS